MTWLSPLGVADLVLLSSGSQLGRTQAQPEVTKGKLGSFGSDGCTNKGFGFKISLHSQQLWLNSAGHMAPLASTPLSQAFVCYWKPEESTNTNSSSKLKQYFKLSLKKY